MDSVSTGLGVFIGSIITLFTQSILKQQENIKGSKFEFKRARYLCIVMLMISFLEPDRRLSKLVRHRPELQTIDDVKEELEAEYYNGFIYAPDEVLTVLEQFVKTPNQQNYLKVVNAMRKDLWGTKTSLKSLSILF